MTTIQERLINARAKLGYSRKAIAEQSGLSEGKIWRIEKKGIVSQEESEILSRLFDILEVNGVVSTTRASRKSSTTNNAPPPSSVVASSSEFIPLTPDPRTVPINWTQLQRVAADVGDHEIERSIFESQQDGSRLFSNSEITTYLDCPRKWWLGWYRKLRLKRESPIGAKAIGDRIHRALQMWYIPEGVPRLDPRTALERLIVSDWTRLSHQLQNDPHQLTSIQHKFNLEANLERAMIEGYIDWLSGTGADSEIRVISSEAYMEAELFEDEATGRKIKIIGKIDARVYRESDGTRLFMDHKTVTDTSSQRAMLPLNPQMLHYHLLEWLSQEENESRCDGALYNMLKKTKRTAVAKGPFYDRVEVRHNIYELNSYKMRVESIINSILDVEERLDSGENHQSAAYPNPTATCTWKCDFFPICPMFDDNSRVEDMITQYYRIGDPLDYYKSNMNDEQELGELK